MRLNYLIVTAVWVLALLGGLCNAEYIRKPEDEGGGGGGGSSGGGEDVIYELDSGHFNLITRKDEHVKDKRVFQSLKRYRRSFHGDNDDNDDNDDSSRAHNLSSLILSVDSLLDSTAHDSTNTSNASAYADAELDKYYYSTTNLIRMALLSVVILAIIFSTLVGNMLVILAVIIVRKLHSQDNANNYLIVSLAVSDMLVGVLAMPFSFYLEVSKGNR
jgi:hypothetical protein